MVGDYLLWGHKPDLGVALFVAAFSIVAMVCGDRGQRSWIACGLLARSCVQFAIGPCLTNFVTLPMRAASLPRVMG